MTLSTVALVGTLRELHSSLPGFGWSKLRDLVAESEPDFLCVEVDWNGWQTGDFGAAAVESAEVLVPLTQSSDITLIPVGAGGRAWGDSGLPLPRTGSLAWPRRTLMAAIDRLTVRTMSVSGGSRVVDSQLLDHICSLLCAAQVALADTNDRTAWDARNVAIAESVLWTACRDPGRRILVALDCRRKHAVLNLLRGQPEVALVQLRSL